MSQHIQRLRMRLVEVAKQWRLTWKVDSDKALEAARHDATVQRRARDRDVAEERKRVDGMLKRFSRIQWERDPKGEYYRVTVTFDPRMVGFHADYADKQELQIMAEYFGRKVEAEVATCRFVQSARDSERERDRRRYTVDGRS